MENAYTTPSQQSVAISNIMLHQKNLLLKFSEIVGLATSESEDRAIAAAQAQQIQVHTSSMIRTVEDLLTLTRALKESWLFGQLGEDSAQEKLDQGVVDENARAVFEWMKAKLREGDVGTPENT